MRNTSFAIAVVMVCAASPVLAQAPDPKQAAAKPDVASRYTFNRVDDGFLRLDNSSGQVAFCSPHTVGWACQAVPEDRAALEKEIARLQDEVASLKTEIASLREPPVPPRPPVDLTPRAGKDGDITIKLPSQEDIARARAALEEAWRRLVDMLVTFQKDVMRKG
jgi:cell division protein FtsB